MDTLYLPVKNNFMSLKELYKKHGLCVAELILNERIYKTKKSMVISFNILILHITGQTDAGPYFHIP